MLQTYQTRVSNIQLNNGYTSEMYLSEYGKFFGILERKLFVKSYINGVSSISLKKTFSKQYGITSRQFNSLRMQLDGKVSSILEKRKLDIEEVESKIAWIQKIVNKKITQKELLHQKLLRIPPTNHAYLKQVKKYRKLKYYIHQKNVDYETYNRN